MSKLNTYLIINAGSSSLKFCLYRMPEKELMVKGKIEKIGEEESLWKIEDNEKTISKGNYHIHDHKNAINLMVGQLEDHKFVTSVNDITAIGHRILHGGEKYSDSVLIDRNVVNDIKKMTNLGPLHHPAALKCINELNKYFRGTPMVAVFDTAFHQTIDKEHYMYPIPYEWYSEYGIRKYGFHGTNYKYITNIMKKNLNKEDVNLIICHIGSGSSICCVKNGKSFNTTMGLTPLAGLMMGTRSGDIDPAIVSFVNENMKKSQTEIMDDLNIRSGFLGISGKNDFRDVEELSKNGDENASLAIEMFKNSITKFIAEYYMELEGNVDAIVFTAGIGENAKTVRKKVIDKISPITGAIIDEEQNDLIAGFKDIKEGIISSTDSKIPVYVIPANEELMIVEDTYNIVEKEKVLTR